MWRDLGRDVVFAFRQWRRSPGFFLAALVTLALGIGANTAIFSVADRTLLRPPPVREPDRLVMVYTTCRRGDPRCSSSYPDYLDYREGTSGLDDLAAYSWVPLNVGADETGAWLASGQVVSGNYFQVLGLAPAAGRLIQPADNRPPAGATAAVLGYRAWQDRFGGDPDVVGREIRLNGSPFTVVGVAPARFRGLDLGSDADVWIPIFAGSRLGAVGAVGQEGIFGARGSRWIHALVGRLAPQASAAQVRTQLLAVSQGLRESDPDARGERSVTVDELSGSVLPTFARDDLVRFVGLLVAVVAATLLLACANLANLLLARASDRRREMGIRRAVGAGSARLVRQLATEAVALALLGGAAGLLLAHWALLALSGFSLPGGVPLADVGLGLDGRIVAFTGLLSVLTGLAFGLLPAFRAGRDDVVSALRGDERGRRPGRGLQDGLVAVQVALCLVLLVGSGLFLRTLRRGLDEDMGFRRDHLALARFNLALLDYGAEESDAFLESMLDRIRSRPEVTSAATASLVPLQVGGHTATFADVEGYTPPPDEEIRVEYVFVSGDYFRTLGMPLLQGRSFGDGDAAGGTPVTVVSRTMAQRYWPGGEATGGRIVTAGRTLEVVGVVEDAIWRRLGEENGNFMFLPLTQYPGVGAGRFMTVAVRTEGSAEAFLPELRGELRALASELSLSSLETMDDQLRTALMPQRMGAILLSCLGGLALVLAALGIWGVVGYSVSRRTREMGVRIALGARRSTVLATAMGGMLRPVLAGLAAGLLAALLLSETLATFLYRVSPTDPLTYGVIAGVLAGVAGIATWLPARRATKVDPSEALRQE